MFCMNCGKKIDDDSTFCPYCGNRAKIATATGGTPISNNGANISSARPTNKKIIFGSIIGLTIVLVIMGVIKIISGLGKTLPEKIFDMSWNEISELSERDFKEMLSDDGVLYESGKYNDIWGFKTETVDSFLGADCLYLHGSAEFDNDIGFEPKYSAQPSVFTLAFENDDDYKDVRKSLENSLEKQMIDNSTVFEDESVYGTSYLYVVEMSDNNVDEFSNFMNDTEDIDLNDCSIYKFVQLYYAKSDDMNYYEIDDFPSNKSYIDYMCELAVFYTPMTQKDYIAFASTYNYDAISGKDIDFDELRENMKYNSLMEGINDSEYSLRSVYFVENHGIDIYENTNVNTDELKRIWYIRNYDFDVETNEKIDISEWGSIDIYIAYTFNYDVKNGTYFENDLDRTKYLIDNNRNPETGDPFKDSTDARLWSMKSLGYDPKSGKEVDTLLADALEEYQKYLDSWENKKLWGAHLDAALIYLDADDIPELIVRDDMDSASSTAADDFTYVLKYTPSGILNFELETDGHTYIYYVPKSGEFCTYTWAGNSYYGFFVEIFDKYILNERSLDEVENLYYSEAYDDNGNLTGIDTSSGLSADFTVSDYIESRQELVDLYDRFIVLRSGDDTDLKVDIFGLYDDLRITKYTTYEYCIYQFEINNGILTVAADDGGNGADGFELETPFSFSYPISEDCIWEDGYGYDRYRYEYGVCEIAVEDVIESIKYWRERYENNPDYIESPIGIRFCIEDEVVIGVYTSTP